MEAVAVSRKTRTNKANRMIEIIHARGTHRHEKSGLTTIHTPKKPDEDFRRAITKDELLKGIFEDMEKIFDK
jgi:hypothetical protein